MFKQTVMGSTTIDYFSLDDLVNPVSDNAENLGYLSYLLKFKYITISDINIFNGNSTG